MHLFFFSVEPLDGTAVGNRSSSSANKNTKLLHHLLIRNMIFICLGFGDTLCEFNNFINSQQAAPCDNDGNSGTEAESPSNNQRESISMQIKPRLCCSACKLPSRKNVEIVSVAAVCCHELGQTRLQVFWLATIFLGFIFLRHSINGHYLLLVSTVLRAALVLWIINHL